MFTRETVQEIRKAIDAALKTVEEKHNVRIDLGNIGFDDQQFSGKLVVKTAEPLDLSKRYPWANYLPLGTKFDSKQGICTIIEHVNKPKYNLRCVNDKGVVLFFNNDQIRQSLIKKGIIKDDQMSDVVKVSLMDNK